MTNYEEEIKALTVCRDHWKTSFEHERANVIRLREKLAALHTQLAWYSGNDECTCEDCKIVREHGEEPKIPIAVPPETAP